MVIIFRYCYFHNGPAAMYSDFRFLQALTELNTLIIDNNNTTSHALFPRLEKLEVLWANGNNITNLALFISTYIIICQSTNIGNINIGNKMLLNWLTLKH